MYDKDINFKTVQKKDIKSMFETRFLANSDDNFHHYFLIPCSIIFL